MLSAKDAPKDECPIRQVRRLRDSLGKLVELALEATDDGNSEALADLLRDSRHEKTRPDIPTDVADVMLALVYSRIMHAMVPPELSTRVHDRNTILLEAKAIVAVLYTQHTCDERCGQ